LAQATSIYCYEDATFPKSLDGTPCPVKVNGIRLLHSQLGLLYKNKLKVQPQELFDRKTTEATNVPQYSKVLQVLDVVKRRLPEELEQLEDHFGGGPVDVRYERDAAPNRKHVSRPND